MIVYQYPDKINLTQFSINLHFRCVLSNEIYMDFLFYFPEELQEKIGKLSLTFLWSPQKPLK